MNKKFNFQKNIITYSRQYKFMSSIGTIKCPSSTFIRQLVQKKEIFNDCGRVNRKDKRYGCVLQFIKKKTSQW